MAELDVSVKFAGLDFKNPVAIASHAPFIPRRASFSDEELSEWDMKLWRKYYEEGAGCLVTGSIFFDEMPDLCGLQRFGPVSTRGFCKREGLIDAATVPDALYPRTIGLMAVEKAKKEFTDMRVIASLLGPGTDPEGWGSFALEAQQAGADALELNLASTMFMDTADQALRAIITKRTLPSGAMIGLVPEVVAEIVKGIKRKVSIPVIVKVTPELGLYGLLGALPYYREGRVDGLLCNHCTFCIAAPDIYNRGMTTHPFTKTTTWWASGGPWNRLAVYRNVTAVAKYAPDIDVEACGGLVIPEHVIEAMMLGAKVVQLSSGIFYNGLSFVGRVVKFMERYMKEQGYNSVNDFIGLGLKYVVEMEEIQKELRAQAGKVIAHIDYDKCIGLDSCRVCLDTWCHATYVEEEKIKVDPARCCACNLCVIRCPHGARSLAWIDK
jgi:dihydropyrimidine dehydrogenase (NAD+) subunit PreA